MHTSSSCGRYYSYVADSWYFLLTILLMSGRRHLLETLASCEIRRTCILPWCWICFDRRVAMKEMWYPNDQNDDLMQSLAFYEMIFVLQCNARSLEGDFNRSNTGATCVFIQTITAVHEIVRKTVLPSKAGQSLHPQNCMFRPVSSLSRPPPVTVHSSSLVSWNTWNRGVSDIQRSQSFFPALKTSSKVVRTTRTICCVHNSTPVWFIIIYIMFSSECKTDLTRG